MAIGSIMHESNSFNPEATTLSDFEIRQGNGREETLRIWSAGNTEVAGMVDDAIRSGLHLVPLIYASATPKGPVQPEAFEELCRMLLDGLARVKPLDGVLLALHGAMFTEAFPHADEEITRRVRAAIGPQMPLVVTHDFHANVPPGTPVGQS